MKKRLLVSTLTLLGSVLSASAVAQTQVPETERWRAKRPTPDAPRAPVLPTFQKTKLDNGLELFVAQVDTVPVVSFSLVVRGGSSSEKGEQAGLTSLVFSLLGEGAGGKDALAFSDAVADLGAAYGAGVSRESGSMRISGLARNADAMLGLLADAALRPNLTEKDFLRVRQEALAGLERQRGSPQGLAFERFPGMVYGEKHPFAHPSSGTVEAVPKIELGDVKAQYQRLMVPGTSAIIAAGDIDLESARALVEKHFAAWSGKNPTLLVPYEVKPTKREEIVFIDKPGAQTIVVMGRPLFGKGSAAEWPLTVANEVFGGSFSSRLNMNLREDKGYSYGAGSRNAHRAGVGALTAYAAVQADKTAESVVEFFGEFERVTTKPFTDDEVKNAKSALIRSMTGQFATSGALAGAASALFMYGLPLDYFKTLPAKYEAVTPEQARIAARQFLTPESMKVLLVGDAKLAEKVKALERGKVRVVKP